MKNQVTKEFQSGACGLDGENLTLALVHENQELEAEIVFLKEQRRRNDKVAILMFIAVAASIFRPLLESIKMLSQ